MRLGMIAAGLAGASALSCAGPAVSADHQAGAPLAPADAAGPWTVESGGHAICVVSLGSSKAGKAGFSLKTPADCGDALPANAAGWQPTADGMRFTGADGQALMGFNRWSNSLLVAHRASGVDVQLRRGNPRS
jgi:hypothetical protein